MEEYTHGKRVNTEGRTNGEVYTIKSVTVHREENTHGGKIQIRKRDIDCGGEYTEGRYTWRGRYTPRGTVRVG